MKSSSDGVEGTVGRRGLRQDPDANVSHGVDVGGNGSLLAHMTMQLS